MGIKLSLKTLFFLFFVVHVNSVFSQQWVDLMMQPDANFYEIRDIFEQEWGNNGYERGKGYKQFKRWANFWETRVLEDGSFPNLNRRGSEFRELITGSTNKSGGVGNWQPLGPFSHNATGSWSPGTGRVNCVVEDPNNPNILYIGAPVGGIWKSINAGVSWTPLGDDLSVIGVSGIVIDPNNSNIIYLATGDSDGGDSYSIGVLKSIDGGLTWNATGAVSGKTTKLIIDPTNSNVIYLASGSGVYKTTDAGVSWNNIQNGNIRDIEFKPGFPNVVYAVTSTSFYISIDSGSSWSTTTSGLPTSSGRLALATTAANANFVYVLSANTSNGFQGVYRSTDSGNSFTAMNTTTDIFESTQAWYDMAIAASQTNANEIVTGALNVWRSTNGGASFTQLNNWNSPSGAAYTHADIHYLKYYGSNLYCGSDGGIYHSTNSGNVFSDLSVGLQIGQFYRIGGSQNDVNTISGGLQDNGGYVLKSGVWKNYYGADGMEAGVDKNNSNLIFGMIQNGDLYRSTDGGNSSSGLSSPMSGRWVTPMQMDPNNNRLLAGYDDLHEYDYTGGWNQLSTFTFPVQLRSIEMYDANSNVILVGTNDNIYITTDNGINFTNISGNLPTNSVITSIEVNPSDSSEIWISRGGWNATNHIYHTVDKGLNWSNLTGGLPNLPCNIVKYDVGSNGGIYVGTDIGVYYRDNDLGNWIQFMNNLPNVVVNDLEINEATNIIRAGTYGRGVWESPNYIVYNNDAGISTILSPDIAICNMTTFDPIVTLINYGTLDLTLVDILYDVDGFNTQTFNWTGTLVQGATIDIALPTMTTNSGSHIFNAVTSLPNGVIDEALNNDLKSKPFNLAAVGNNVTLALNTDCWGSETTWEVRDTSGALIVSGGSYSDNSGGDLFLESLCLADGCYEFIINDSYGDGLNGIAFGCSVNGNYTLTDIQSNVLVQMTVADFNYQAIHNFCIAGVGLVVEFNATTATTICEGASVDFIDITSSGTPTSWNWTFSGGTPATSTLQNPTGIVYNVSGNYMVELIISDGVTADTITTNSYVTVNPSLVVGLSSTNPACGINDGQITATASGGTGILSYSWSNGAVDSIINGLGVGVYTVVVSDVNSCSQTAQSTLFNVGGPTVTISGSQTICEGDSVSISASGGVAYNWDQGLGAGASQLVAPNVTTTYMVVVSDNNGCSTSSSTVITVDSSPIVIVIPNLSTICVGDSVLLVASGAQSYLWSTTEITNSITVAPLVNTSYNIQGQSGNCSSVVDVFVTVSPDAIAVAGADNYTVVVGQMIGFTNVGSVGSIYAWNFGDGNTSTNGSPSFSYSGVGTYTVVLQVALGNCISTDTIMINVGATGIVSNETTEGFSIYPNPVSSELHIVSKTTFERVRFEILDAQGKSIFSGVFTPNSIINVGELANGMYVIRFENGQKGFLQFVKE